MQLEGVGLSVVAPTQELLYARLAGIQARATQSKARRTLEAAVRHVQADNTLASATYPVIAHDCTRRPSSSPPILSCGAVFYTPLCLCRYRYKYTYTIA